MDILPLSVRSQARLLKGKTRCRVNLLPRKLGKGCRERKAASFSPTAFIKKRASGTYIRRRHIVFPRRFAGWPRSTSCCGIRCISRGGQSEGNEERMFEIQKINGTQGDLHLSSGQPIW